MKELVYTKTKIPEVTAREITKLLEIKEYPINLMEVLKKVGLSFKEENLSGGVEAMLVMADEKAGIIINKKQPYQERKNFSIAHELGHYFITSHQGQSYQCVDIGQFGTKKNHIELEADQFASEFLMPTQEFLKEECVNNPTIENIISASKKYNTSITATAIKCMDLTEESCAIVVIQNDKLLWSRKSENFFYDINPKIKETYAYEIRTEGKEREKNVLYSHFWGSDFKSDYIEEDCINFKRLDKQLCLIKEYYN